MTDFKVGDKVRYVGKGKGTMSPEWIGLEGVITNFFGSSVTLTVTKSPNPNSPNYGVGAELYPWTTNLELVTEEPKFTFKDIRVGDIIRRTILRADGSKIIWEGKAHRRNNSGESWLSKDNYHLAYKMDDNLPECTFELLERTLNHWTQEKPLGSMGLSGEGINKRVWTKIRDDLWDIRYLTNIISHGPLRSNEAAHNTESIIRNFSDVAADDLEWLK